MWPDANLGLEEATAESEEAGAEGSLRCLFGYYVTDF
jgi:hypothetical protein